MILFLFIYLVGVIIGFLMLRIVLQEDEEPSISMFIFNMVLALFSWLIAFVAGMFMFIKFITETKIKSPISKIKPPKWY